MPVDFRVLTMTSLMVVQETERRAKPATSAANAPIPAASTAWKSQE